MSNESRQQNESTVESGASTCCGGPAPSGTDACCVRDAEVKSSGGSGCGCGSRPRPVAPSARCCA